MQNVKVFRFMASFLKQKTGYAILDPPDKAPHLPRSHPSPLFF